MLLELFRQTHNSDYSTMVALITLQRLMETASDRIALDLIKDGMPVEWAQAYGDTTVGMFFGTASESGIKALSGLTSKAKYISNIGADNIALYESLKEQIAFKEANSIFTKNGTLKPEVVKESIAVIKGSQLKNDNVVKALTSDGSEITDWAKMTTQTFRSPIGPFQVHFYKNLKTGQVSMYEMKVKFND